MTNKKENVNNQLNFNFLTNNVKGLQSSKKRVKIFKYFKDKMSQRYFNFTRNTLTQKNNGMTNLRVNYNSLTVKPIHVVYLLQFYDNVNLVVKNQFNDDNGRILILEETSKIIHFQTKNFFWCYTV